MRVRALIASVVLAVCCPGAAQTAQPASITPATAAAHSSNELALALLGRLGGANVVFSPYSIDTALAMVDQGARRQTAAQIDLLLGVAPASALARADRALRAQLAADAPQLLIANDLWVQSGLSLKSRFTSTLASDFGAAPGLVDFAHDAAGARQQINGWIARHTGGLIPNLMAPTSITPMTRLVLANAIYMKARWLDPFDHALTRRRAFIAADGRRVQAEFMTQAPTVFRYGASLTYKAVELPYRHSSLSMLLVMPAAGTLKRFQLNVPAIEASLRSRELDLSMPRFHLTTHVELNGTLAALGMPLSFTDQADFSGITDAAKLTIQAVEHGADLMVDEAGTVAAAATGVSLEPTAAVPTTRLVLDHPFLAVIRDRRTGAILFAARVADPTQA